MNPAPIDLLHLATPGLLLCGRSAAPMRALHRLGAGSKLRLSLQHLGWLRIATMQEDRRTHSEPAPAAAMTWPQWRLVLLLMAVCFTAHFNRVGMAVAGDPADHGRIRDLAHADGLAFIRRS